MSVQQNVSPWRPQHLDGHVPAVDSSACATSPAPEPDSDPEGLAALAAELERVRREGYEQGVADAEARFERDRQSRHTAEEGEFRGLVRELSEIRAHYDRELEGTLHALLTAINRVVFTRSWQVDDELLRECVHAALEVFDEIHPPLAVHVSAADAPRIERVLADAALATPVRIEADFEPGHIEITGAQRSASLDLPDRLEAALRRLTELDS